MSNKTVSKKQNLLARKEELLNEIKYYEKRIEEARAGPKDSHVYYEDDSSDSEIEFTIHTDPSAYELKERRAQLQTCLHATEELTGLTVLQSEVNIVLSVPDFEGEAPITEEGVWREVMAECRIDLVSFSVTFYTHQPSRQFAPPAYRGLRVLPAKLVHEKELAHSVLPCLATPSDAVEVLRSYAQAHRSRRTTLARLADKYADSLFMETLPEGGYLLKCAGRLSASWVLLNKWSAVAPFYHHLVFDLDNVDENYAKTIEQAHKQLSDSTLDTDDRTSLLAEIIDACLEARGHVEPDSDADSQNSKKPADQEAGAPVKPSEMMGPPKSLPKKCKPKGKENTLADERKRRSDTDAASGEGTAKKAKTDPKIADSKDKCNSKSKNSKKKFSDNESRHSKNGNCEQVAENTYFSNNDLCKGSKNTEDLARVSTKSKNNDALKNADVIKTTDTVKSKSKAANVKASEKKISTAKNGNNNDNLKTVQSKVAQKELNTKDKIVPAEKEAATLTDKYNEGNFDKSPVPQKSYANSTAVAIKNPNTKPNVEENEPKTKKTKTSAAEKNKKMPGNSKSATQNINSAETGEHTSQKIILKNTGVSEKNIQKADKNIKNVAEKHQENFQNQVTKINKERNQKVILAATKKQQNLDENDEQNENYGNNQHSETFKKVQSKENVTKSKTSNIKDNAVQNPSVPQTLSERFSSKAITETHNTEAKSKNPNKNKLINNTLQANNQNSNKMPKTSSNIQNKIDPLHKTNQKFDKNVLQTKLSIKKKDNLRNKENTDTTAQINIEMDKMEILAKPNNVVIDLNVPKTNLNDKLKLNNQKSRKSPGVVKKAASKNSKKSETMGNNQKSIITQKRLLISKNSMKNPLRISPRKHQSKFSTTRDSSKTSTGSLQKQSHIPRLLKKPTVKP